MSPSRGALMFTIKILRNTHEMNKYTEPNGKTIIKSVFFLFVLFSQSYWFYRLRYLKLDQSLAQLFFVFILMFAQTQMRHEIAIYSFIDRIIYENHNWLVAMTMKLKPLNKFFFSEETEFFMSLSGISTHLLLICFLFNLK